MVINKECLKERYGRHYQNVMNQSADLDFRDDHIYKNFRRSIVNKPNILSLKKSKEICLCV